MTKSTDNERWLSDGNCKFCRRNKYCHTPCKKNKERMQTELYRSINNVTHGVFGHLLEKQTRLFNI
jgi:radical SAM protein with 4Fe4S-binding SPASM domain